ncbi:MAG: GH25 family lysozyme [Candidatus Limnocylindrales bacterium]|nr:GH25 family lysozyme [Candidatus Limnocylindrales bacterium]
MLPSVVVALALALAAVPLASRVAAADAGASYAANCTVRLRSAPATSATSLVSMPAGTVVTTTGSVAGGAWSASCPTAVSGSTWYAISAVDGTSVATLYGVSVAYAATGLFTLSAAPPPPPAVTLEGIDVSHYQGVIDWPSVAAAGKHFAIVQATDGETCLDPMYATNHANARAAGTRVTAYHFAEPSSTPGEAIVQADWFVNSAALLPGDLVPALDLEQTGGLSVSDLQAWVGAWLGEVTAKLGVRPMIYASPAFWATSMGDTTMFADQGYSVLWIAHWGTSSPTVPAGNWDGHGWTFWQYTSTGSVAGISGNVDLDRFNGSDLTPVAFNYTYVPPPTVVPPNATPVLAGVTPNSAPAGGSDLAITIQGANFACAVSTAYWNGTPLHTSYVSPSRLAAVVPAALIATPGVAAVTVVNQAAGGASAPVAFNVTGSTGATPPPVIAALTPDSAAVGGGNLTIAIQGANYAAGVSTAFWNGAQLATTYVSPTQLTAVVPAALTTTPGIDSVTVVNQAPGGGASAPAAFNVVAALPPVLAAVTPNSAPAGGGGLTITIHGANFAAGASTAYWDGLPIATTYVSPTQLTAVVPAALMAAPEAASVSVINQTQAGGASAAVAFNLTAPRRALRIGASSALGLNPATGYTTATPKVARAGRYVTWKFGLGAAQAGQRVNILVATRAGTAFGVPKYYKSLRADAKGVVTVAWTRATAGAINVRVQLPASPAYAASTSPALAAVWR